MNAVDRFSISYLFPEISATKERYKYQAQNWSTANSNNSPEYSHAAVLIFSVPE